MKGNEIRKRFLQYFADRGHAVVQSSSLVPADDPTLLFTNAGMVQFKRMFMGEEQREYVRAATVQRCVRAGGKHNDLENVGHTARHHTFFEMLGNFSFGDYFKKEAIAFAWDFLTRELGLDPARLWVSVFRDDDEAFALWEEIDDLPPGRIVRLGEADNFWAMGDTGPCGPCSEIHIDQGPEAGCGRPDCRVGCDCDRFLELWNLVFMQFYRDESGTMTPLPRPSIDTGMGLERVAAVLQGKLNNFESDLFAPLIERIGFLAGKRYGMDSSQDVAMRVIADHARATAFLVADGVLPSNEGRGYVLRRIIRRAVRFGRSLDMREPFFGNVCNLVVDEMQDAYPHLVEARKLLEKVTLHEENRFGETLDHGLAMLSEELDRLRGNRDKTPRIGGEFIFKLYDTYGFPVDIVRDIAREQGVSLDEQGFHACMEQQRSQSKKSWKGIDMDHMAAGIVSLLQGGRKTEFLGYDAMSCLSTVDALVGPDGELVTECSSGDEVQVYCPSTVFYAEAGGQVGDRGIMTWPGGRLAVHDTRSPGEGLVLHRGTIEEGVLKVGQEVKLQVTDSKRRATARNHTATHLLHAAMKQILGGHVKQAGSLVNDERLRFDFTHYSALAREEIQAIEKLVNERILDNIPVQTRILGREEAIRDGATALFGEKYGDRVRVVSIGDFSKELCGGTHTGRTGDIGLFKIVAENSIAAGVRRIEAVTGEEALAWVQRLERQADEVTALLSCPMEVAADKISSLLKRQKELEREMVSLRAAMAMSDLDRLFAEAEEVADVRVIAGQIPLDSPKTLREVGDRVRDRMGTGVAVLGGEFNGKAALLALVSKDLVARIKAGDLVKQVAAIVGGGGGGRPDMAQAGGPRVDKLPEAISRAPEIVAAMLQDRSDGCA